MTRDYSKYKAKLEEEKSELEVKLGEVGRKDPDNPSNWEAVSTEHDASQADENTVADSIEEYGSNEAILTTLETRYQDVKSGLDKIEKGVYGTCQVCGQDIDDERLEANPAARTCREHMNQVV